MRVDPRVWLDGNNAEGGNDNGDGPDEDGDDGSEVKKKRHGSYAAEILALMNLLEMRWKSRVYVVEEWAGLSKGSLLSTYERKVDVNADDLDFEMNMESYETSIQLGLMQQKFHDVVTGQREKPIHLRAFDLSDFLCIFCCNDQFFGVAAREDLARNTNGGGIDSEVDGRGNVVEEEVDSDSDSEVCNFEILLPTGESDDDEEVEVEEKGERDIGANVKREGEDNKREDGDSSAVGPNVGRNPTKVEMNVEMADIKILAVKDENGNIVGASSPNLRRSGRLSTKSQGSRNSLVASSIVVKVKEEDNGEADVMIVDGRAGFDADSVVGVVLCEGGDGR
ncbi:hypothetical protein HDU76_013882 [Blyttiomyces sp. JEL0837]|nr:hypothetical protein HDU76_013882 [Blyttiomyces sp. JEL0837]